MGTGDPGRPARRVRGMGTGDPGRHSRVRRGQGWMGRVIRAHAHSRAAGGPVRSRRTGAAVSQVVRAVVFGGFSPAPLSPPQLGLSHAQQLR